MTPAATPVSIRHLVHGKQILKAVFGECLVSIAMKRLSSRGDDFLSKLQNIFRMKSGTMSKGWKARM